VAGIAVDRAEVVVDPQRRVVQRRELLDAFATGALGAGRRDGVVDLRREQSELFSVPPFWT
jgi:hypothetical protein